MWPNELWIKLYLAREHLCLSHIVDFNWQWWLFKNTHDSTACLSFVIPTWQIVHFSLFPRTSTLWTNIDFSWSRRWTTLHPFWMSSSTRKSSNRTNTIQSGLCKPVGRRWGSSILVPYTPVRPAKTSSTKSLRKRSQDSLMPSRRRSECGGETPFLGLPEHKTLFETKNREMLMLMLCLCSTWCLPSGKPHWSLPWSMRLS